MKNYNVMIDGRNFNFFHQKKKKTQQQTIKNISHDKIQKITTAQGDDYITGCLLHYPYFEKY